MKRTSPLSERCLECKYVGYGTSHNIKYLPGRACSYLVMVGKPRGCPPGDECDKFEQKKEK